MFCLKSDKRTGHYMKTTRAYIQPTRAYQPSHSGKKSFTYAYS